jgi:hypothetical protein
MRRLFIAAVVLLWSSEAGLTQSVTTTPGIGLTSPLGIPGSTSSGSPTGIPLGATEIDPGGIGPTPIGPMSSSSSCIGTTSSSTGVAGSSTGMAGGAAMGTTGASSSFDGGGMASATTSSSCSAPSSGVVSSTGTASPLSNPGASATSNLGGGAIPLGATELDSGGVSSLIGVPAPSVTATPCVGSTMTNGLMSGSSGPTGSIGTGGMTSSSGC